MDSVSHIFKTLGDFVASPVGLVWCLTASWLVIFHVWRTRRNLEEAILMEVRARGLGVDVQKAQIRRVNAFIVAVWMSMIYIALQTARLAYYYLADVSVNAPSSALLGVLTIVPAAIGMVAVGYVLFFSRALPHVSAGKGKDRVIRLTV